MLTQKSGELRAKWSEGIIAARAILDGADGDKLSAEDEQRYDKLMAEALDFRKAAEREEQMADQERDLDEKIETEPPKVVRSTPKGDDIITDEAELSADRRSRRTPEYRAAFKRFLRGQLSGEETRALQVDSDTAGGYLVAPEQFMTSLIKGVDDIVHIRQRATTYMVENAQSLGVPSLAADPDDFDWTTELQTGSEDSSMAFGKREFKPQPMAKRVKLSKKLLRASTMDPEGLVRQRLAYKVGVTQEKAYLTGSGAGRPLGVFVASDDGVPSGRDVTATNATSFVGDDLQDVIYSLKPQYRSVPTTAWMFHRDAVKMAAKLKDGEGRYLLHTGQAGADGKMADTILGFPFMESEFAPNTFTTGLYVGMLADWSWYWIVDALDMTIQRLVELYAETNQDGFISRYEGDGMPVLPEAFARLKLA